MAQTGGDSFDMYNGPGGNLGVQSRWALFGGLVVPLAVVPGRVLPGRPSGGQAVELTQGGNAIQRQLVSNEGEYTFHIAWYPKNFAAEATLIAAVRANNATQVSLWSTVTGGFEIKSGDNGSVLATSPNGLWVTQTYYSLELATKIDPAAGSVALSQDAIPVISTVTGLDTDPLALGYMNQLMLGSVNVAPAAWVSHYDDFTETFDLTMLGPARGDVLLATADVAVTWTPLTGANWQEVSEALADGSVSYVYTGTNGNADLYDLASLPITPTTIFGVQAVDFAQLSDANPHTIYQLVKSSGTLSTGGAVSLNGNWNRFDRMLATDPATGVAWLPAAVNAIERGPELVS